MSAAISDNAALLPWTGPSLPRVTALKRLLFILSLTAGLLALAVGLGHQYAPLQLGHWRKQLQALPDQSAEPLLEQVASSGDAGIAILVEGLGSPRARVAQAARQVLVEQIGKWKGLPAANGSAKLALLADELADRAADLGPAGRHDAAELALLILQGPVDQGAVDGVAVISCCEKVLRAAEADPATVVTGALAKRGDADAATTRMAGDGPGAPSRLVEGQPLRQADLAGDDTSPLRGVRGATDSPLQGPVEGVATVPGTASGLPGHGGRVAGRLGHLSDSSAAKPLGLAGSSPSPPATTASAESPLVRQVSAVEKLPGDGSSNELKAVDMFELFERTRSDNEPLAAPARAELLRRGFTEVHFDLARRLFDADPAVRKDLARTLPELRSIDAAPWLLQLSRDANAEVRLTAITLMATSGDPTLLEQVERIAGDDSDPRIREQVAHIAQQRNDAGQRGDSNAARPQPQY
jgi:hypothetical protein